MDLNSDLGEGFGPWSMGDDAAMLGVVTSANIACGGHASDPDTMFATLRMAAERGVVIGAHPGYADPLGFGRRVIPMEPIEIARMVAAQVGALQGVAALAGAKVAYVKAHGALANLAADRREVADAIASAVKALPGGLAILAISGTELEAAGRAAERLIGFLDTGLMPVVGGDPIPLAAQSICVHGDSPDAVAMAREIRTRLQAAGVVLAPFLR